MAEPRPNPQAHDDPPAVRVALILAAVLVVARLEEFAYGEAAAIAVVLLAMSFTTLFSINLLERWSTRHA